MQHGTGVELGGQWEISFLIDVDLWRISLPYFPYVYVKIIFKYLILRLGETGDLYHLVRGKLSTLDSVLCEACLCPPHWETPPSFSVMNMGCIHLSHSLSGQVAGIFMVIEILGVSVFLSIIKYCWSKWSLLILPAVKFVDCTTLNHYVLFSSFQFSSLKWFGRTPGPSYPCLIIPENCSFFFSLLFR